MTDLAVKGARALWHRLGTSAQQTITDHELLTRFAEKRDEKAFETLIVRHGKMVLGVCLRLLNHRQDAEDAFQATFLVLARRASSVGRSGLLANWLFGVARRTALGVRRYRAKQAKEQMFGQVDHLLSTPVATWSELGSILDEELAQLPSRYRLPLVLCCLEGMSQREAGRCLTWPTGTVAGRLSRARELLRKRLARRGIEVSATLMGTAMAEGALSAMVPTSFIALTVRSSIVAASTRLTAVFVSPCVSCVVKQVLSRMLLVRLACLFGLGMIVAGLATASVWWTRSPLAMNDSQVAMILAPAPQPLMHLAKQITLPSEPQSEVLRFSRSDQNPAKPGYHLTIRAGGDVDLELSKPINGGLETKHFSGKLSNQELQDLMQFIVNEQEFLEFDGDRVAQKLKDEYDFEGQLPSPYDTATTEIHLQTAEREHGVHWNQLSSSAVFFPDEKQIQQLIEIEKRINNIIALLKAGGREQATTVTNLLNARLQQIYPQLLPMTLADLAHTEDGNDSSTYTYARGNKYRGPSYFSVTFKVPKEGNLRILSVIPGPSRSPPFQPQRRSPPACLDADFYDP